MSNSTQSIHVIDAVGEPALEHVRDLFRRYATEFAGSIAESLCFQGFEAELSGLPGRYTPSTGCVLLAVDGERPIGCVALRDIGDATCEMKRLYVLPEYRRKDVGRTLVAELLRRAESAGYRRMVLDTLPSMERAIALYRSLGFADTARYWDNPITEAIYLERLLGHDSR